MRRRARLEEDERVAEGIGDRHCAFAPLELHDPRPRMAIFLREQGAVVFV